MSKTYRNFDSWNEYDNPSIMATDNIRRTTTYKTEYEHLGDFYGEDVWDHKKALRRQLNKRARLRTRNNLRNVDINDLYDF